VAVGAATIAGTSSSATASEGRHDQENVFRQVNLVSDLPDVAQLIDPAVKNPWGIAFGPKTPLWVNNNFNPASDCGTPTCVPAPETLLTQVTVYKGANGHDPFVKVPLEVTVSAGTGIVFNPTSRFVVKQGGVTAPATFLFNEVVPNAQGTGPVAEITGWTNAAKPLPKKTVAKVKKDGAFYFGLALIPGMTGEDRKSGEDRRSGPLLLAADGVNGTIDVFDGKFKQITLRKGAFVDPTPSAQPMAPYNVAYLGGRVYVAYTPATEDGSGDSAVSVFTRDGRFIKRLVTGSPLAGPWGMAIAPEDWGDFGGALLVGNVDDGKINAFNPRNGHQLGTVSDAQGKPLANPGLWGIAFGNGTIGTPHSLVFAAGIGSAPGGFGADGYTHGLVGLIEPVSHDDGDDD
jgi:uncharacterized protein (TIGR03118 family)